MSIHVMSAVWKNSTAREGALLVMLAIADCANEAGEAWPSIAMLTERARLSRRQVQYIIRERVKAGELEVEEGGGGRGQTHLYRVQLLRPRGEKGAIDDTKRVQSRVQSATDKGAAHFIRSVKKRQSRNVKETSVSSGRARGEELLADDAFTQPLKERFSSLDFDYETGKWLDWIEESPPKKNYRLSIKNWLENAVKFKERDNGRTQGNKRLAHTPSGREGIIERWQNA